MTLPDGGAETVNQQAHDAQLLTNVTRLDGQQTQSINSIGQTTSQSGAGVTPASYGYDPVTGELSSLILFPSGSTSNTTGEETTGWKYGLSTGLLSTKTYADGSTDTFLYNNKLQLSAESLRGNTASFNYNTAGMQTGATYIGCETGTTIYDSLGTLDDLGRSHVMTEVTTSAGGQSNSTSDVLSYNPQGQVATEAQATGVNVHYDYNADSSIQDMKLYQNGQVISETNYAYDPISKRLQTITINGVTYTYAYKTNTNLVSSVSSSANTVSYGYESNTGRLQSISATGASQTDYSAGYTYTANDQRLTENVLQENPDTQAIDQRNWTFGYDNQDQLASVSDNGTTLYSYNYDGVGNPTGGDGFNTMNQSPDFQYDVHGDITDDGQFTYTWDSKARLTSVQPDYPDDQSQKEAFTYDPENRRTQEDLYTWNSDNQVWIYASSLKFVYDGSQMVAELDGQNYLLQSYAWGPTGTLLSITDYNGGTPKNYQVVTDGSGNVVELLDSSTGLVAASYQYDPWGNPLSATGPAANVSPFRWQGEFYDASFGGYDMGAREGSARLHIFLSPDPSGESSDDNLYREVGNDPINTADPTGLSPQTLPSQSTTQPTPLAYGGTFLDNMTPIAAAVLVKALVVSPNGRLTNQQAFSIPLTNADAMVYLHATGKDEFAVTPGKIRDAVEGGFFQMLFGDGGYAYDSYATALKKNPVLGMTKDQYYEKLATAHNVAMARDAMQMQGNMMAYLYARLALPTADLITIAVMAPASIPSSSSLYTPGFVPVAPRIVPIGVPKPQFTSAAALIDADSTIAEIGGEIVVQGSRAAGTAGVNSDIDIAVQVSPEQFERLVKSSFGTPNAGSAAERTMLHAIEVGKINARPAGLSALRDQLQAKLGVEVDLSIIKQGGQFDKPPFVALP